MSLATVNIDERAMMRSEKNYDLKKTGRVSWIAYRGTKSIRAKEKQQLHRELREYQ